MCQILPQNVLQLQLAYLPLAASEVAEIAKMDCEADLNWMRPVTLLRR